MFTSKMKRTYFIGMLALLGITMATQAVAQKVPFIKNIKQLDVKTDNISKMRVNVYNVTQNKNGIISTDKLIDYPVEIYFDSLGNRIKEVVYETNGKKLHTTLWDYDILKETVGKYQLDTFNRQVSKKIFQSNIKEKNTRIKTYGETDTLLIENFWMVGATGKTINNDHIVYEPTRGIIAQKTTKTYDISTGKSIEYLVETLVEGEDCSWFPAYLDDLAKARDKKTRVEKFYDTTQLIYKFDDKKKLLTEKDRLDKEGKITEKGTYQYEFDGNGNWTKITQYINDQPALIAIRVFEYRVAPIIVKKKK